MKDAETRNVRRVVVVTEGDRIVRIVDNVNMTDDQVTEWLDGMAAAGIPVEREGRDA